MEMKKESPWWSTKGVCGNIYYDQRDLTRDIKRRIAECIDGVSEISSHQDFFLDIFSHHASWEEKKGPGISHIELKRFGSKRRPFYGVLLHRVDGEIVDISWRKSLLKNGEMEHSKVVLKAAKYVIKGILSEFRKSLNMTACWHCSKTVLYGKENIDIYHIPPKSFSSIFFDFLGEMSLSIDDIPLESYGNLGEIGFSDQNLMFDWQEFYRKNARFKAIHHDCHQKFQNTI